MSPLEKLVKMENTTVLITGDTGFIGSNLKRWLIDAGISVKGFSRRNGFDVLNLDQLRREAEGCGLIYHLAAYAKPAQSVLEPGSAVKVNIEGTMNALEVCKELGIPLLYPSSCEIYGDSTTPINEDHPLRPPNPYAASKAAADVICYCYFKCYGVDVKIVRLFNPYGPKQQLNKVIPTFYFQAIENRPLTVYQKGSDTRDYVYIDDIVRGLYLAKDLPAGEVINLATGRATTTLELAQKLLELTGSHSPISFVDYPQAFGGIKQQVGSGKKAKSLIQWEPSVSLTEGIEKTLQWLRNREDF